MPTSKVSIQHYRPSQDKSFSLEERRYRPDVLIVTVQGEAPRTYPFVLPCEYRPEWTSIEAFAQDVGRFCMMGEPVKDGDPIGRSMVRGWIALTDGTVYITTTPGNTELVFAELLPIRLDPAWLPDQAMSHDPAPMAPGA